MFNNQQFQIRLKRTKKTKRMTKFEVPQETFNSVKNNNQIAHQISQKLQIMDLTNLSELNSKLYLSRILSCSRQVKKFYQDKIQILLGKIGLTRQFPLISRYACQLQMEAFGKQQFISPQFAKKGLVFLLEGTFDCFTSCQSLLPRSNNQLNSEQIIGPDSLIYELQRSLRKFQTFSELESRATKLILVKEDTRILLLNQDSYKDLRQTIKQHVYLNKINFLRAYLFPDMLPTFKEIWDLLNVFFQQVVLPFNTLISEQGKTANFMYIVVQGQARTYKSMQVQNKKVKINIRSLLKGDIFGQQIILHKQEISKSKVFYQCSTVLITQTKMLRISRQSLSKLVKDFFFVKPLWNSLFFIKARDELLLKQKVQTYLNNFQVSEEKSEKSQFSIKEIEHLQEKQQELKKGISFWLSEVNSNKKMFKILLTKNLNYHNPSQFRSNIRFAKNNRLANLAGKTHLHLPQNHTPHFIESFDKEHSKSVDINDQLVLTMMGMRVGHKQQKFWSNLNVQHMRKFYGQYSKSVKEKLLIRKQ